MTSAVICGESRAPALPPSPRQVFCAGQAVGLVVADTLAHAQDAARAVDVAYTPLPAPSILSIDEAIAANSFLVESTFDPGHVQVANSQILPQSWFAFPH